MSWLTIPDEKHAQAIFDIVGYSEERAPGRSVRTPGVNRTNKEEPEKLDSDKASLYRSGAGSAIFLASDCEAITFASKELARGLSAPDEEHYEDLTRLARWLWEHRGWLTENKVDEETVAAYRAGERLQLCMHHDSDWASSKVDRRSTTGMRATIGGFRVSHSSGTQPGLPALSSGEAELRSMSRACCSSIYIQKVAAELLISVDITLMGDSTAAMANAAKLGPGRIRHLEAAQMAVKEAVRRKLVRLRKVDGSLNTSDLHTKHVDGKTLDGFLPVIGFRKATEEDLAYSHCDQFKLNELSSLQRLPQRAPSEKVLGQAVRVVEHDVE